MASPAAAHLVLARLSGPVGLAETNSTLIRRPESDSPLPYAAAASTIVRANSPSEPAERVMLRNPGPATSTAPMPAIGRNRAAIASATSRGGRPALLASRRAMFVA